MDLPRSRFVDLTHPFRNGMPMAPGLPPPRFEPFLTRAASRAAYAGQAEFEITRLFLVGNTGTALDSPYHRHADGLDSASLPLDRLVGLDGWCIDARTGPRRGRRIDGVLPDRPLAGSAVLFRTGHAGRWGTDAYWTAGPSLGAEIVEALIRAEVALVGVDFANVDDRSDPARPAHTRLLAAGIPIVENLGDLAALPSSGFRVFAAPLPIERGAAVPARVFAELPSPDEWQESSG